MANSVMTAFHIVGGSATNSRLVGKPVLIARDLVSWKFRFALDSPTSSGWLKASLPSQGRRLTVILQSCFLVFVADESY
jgi:hypothetical protein